MPPTRFSEPSALGTTRSTFSGFRFQVSGFLLALLVTICAPGARAATASEADLKAAFLFNFALFTAWPESALPPEDKPFVIGVLGTDPFGPSLDRIVTGENILGHRIVVQRFARAADARACHLIYIGRSEEARLPQVLAEFRGRPVLTVSDIDRFAYAGGVIGMVLEQGKVRVQVNVNRAHDANLTIGTKLLRIARVISDDAPKSMLPGDRLWRKVAE